MDRRIRPANLLVRFAKLKGPTAALRAARHNLRELALTPNITPGQQHLNLVLLGHQTAEAVNAAYKAQLEAAGIDKLRVDAVRLIEALVSLPVGIHDDKCAYFQAALDWMATEFGSANLLSAVVHKDESAQHMHVLIVPLVHGRMQGSDLLGGKAQLRARLARFEQAMQAHAAALGLQDHSEMALTAEQMAGEVIRALQHRKDPMWKSCVAQLLRNCIEHLCGREPSIAADRPLVYVGQHGIRAAEGQQRGLGKEPSVGQSVGLASHSSRACGSMKRRMSQALASRSTQGRCRVAQRRPW